MSRHAFLQAGDFNLRMSVQSPSETSDGFGGFTKTWSAQFDVWARIIPISAALITTMSGSKSELSHYIYIRKRQGLKSGMRFVKGVREFLIETIQDPDETGRYLVCAVSESACKNTEGSA